MKKSNKKNLIERLSMPLPELEKYYRERRRECFENNEPFTGVRFRKMMHPVLVCGLKILHFFKRQKITVIGDKRIPTQKPIIFAATHIGWDDVEMIFSAIGTHAYLFWGDPRESYKTMDGFLLDINGAIICDTDNKNDRYIGKEKCIQWLNQGGNLLIFPEGEWNITENKSVMYLFNGTAEMAIRTGADIVPIAIEQFGKEFRVNIGQNIETTRYQLDSKQKLTDKLRDDMATLKWEIYDTTSIVERKIIPENASEMYKQFFIEQANGVFTWQDFCQCVYKPREITPPEEAFGFMKKLEPNKRNAFLFEIVPKVYYQNGRGR